jgi:UDP-N-acetylmuramoylalanine-D-glutamate ligase
VRELEQAVGLAAHGAHDHDHVVALLLSRDCASGDVLDSFERTDRSATEFLDYESHEFARVRVVAEAYEVNASV